MKPSHLSIPELMQELGDAEQRQMRTRAEHYVMAAALMVAALVALGCGVWWLVRLLGQMRGVDL